MNTHTRNIRSGDQYKQLIPLPSNRKVYLGEGDTFLSLDQMSKLIKETLSETKQLAKQLAGNTTKQSVANVKEFLYWHIQYLQDEVEQFLQSPARTWSNRSTGVDCKSYSVFASSLLTNMGIKNSLRQIKQVSFNPQYWSHVYVIVPGTNLVIDGTVLYNTEPLFAEKYDTEILATGLQGLRQLENKLAGNWCDRHKITTTNSNISSSNIEKSKGDARLTSSSIKELIDGQGFEKSTDQIKTVESEPLLQNPDTSNSDRLRFTRTKANARKRKLLLT